MKTIAESRGGSGKSGRRWVSRLFDAVAIRLRPETRKADFFTERRCRSEGILVEAGAPQVAENTRTRAQFWIFLQRARK
jgi:hypothetical protein